ncbi:chemotaxis protein MotB [Symbiobacterium terraclitae]|uniref:Chemotaxis protein MotB n=1 Tax=Symbiobacterium terraclitae TaxID=557451 RepID=A0ABS4JNB7_9FIRM|nr:flagellar motor protein MotB [Symbiobacterium terraclitae]MBP2017024.1 chemotaxis protein MotB [Symbiobacterium terraclitae]
MARTTRATRGDHEGGGGGHGGSNVHRWMVSYADFMTLMFIVFVVMFSFARVDTAKYTSLARSLAAALGPLGPDIAPLPARGQEGTAMPIIPPDRPGSLPDVPDWPAHLIAPPEEPPETNPVPPVEPPPAALEPSPEPSQVVTAEPGVPEEFVPPPEPVDPLAEVADIFRGLPGVRSGLIAVALEERGIVLSVAGSLLFNPGEYALRPEAAPYLAEVAEKLQGVELPIMVNGTADGSGEGAAGFELAALRAGAVVKFLSEQHGIPADRFVYFGYGDNSTNGDHVTIVVARKQPM